MLRPAHQTTVALGAGPLRREIELLAQRGCLHLDERVDTTATPKAPPSAAASLGLTRREAEVLALVTKGQTNRQIGQALFITPKAASVHVSRNLAKLEVAGRGEAAAIAIGSASTSGDPVSALAVPPLRPVRRHQVWQSRSEYPDIRPVAA